MVMEIATHRKIHAVFYVTERCPYSICMYKALLTDNYHILYQSSFPMNNNYHLFTGSVKHLWSLGLESRVPHLNRAVRNVWAILLYSLSMGLSEIDERHTRLFHPSHREWMEWLYTVWPLLYPNKGTKLIYWHETDWWLHVPCTSKETITAYITAINFHTG